MSNQKPKAQGLELGADVVIGVGADFTRPSKTDIEKQAGKRYRHVTKANVNARKAQGWVVDSSQESQLDDHVVMYTSEERVAARNARLEQRNKLNESEAAANVAAARIGPTAFERR